jgi:hypothetical protein
MEVASRGVEPRKKVVRRVLAIRMGGYPRAISGTRAYGVGMDAPPIEMAAVQDFPVKWTLDTHPGKHARRSLPQLLRNHRPR